MNSYSWFFLFLRCCWYKLCVYFNSCLILMSLFTQEERHFFFSLFFSVVRFVLLSFHCVWLFDVWAFWFFFPPVLLFCSFFGSGKAEKHKPAAILWKWKYTCTPDMKQRTQQTQLYCISFTVWTFFYVGKNKIKFSIHFSHWTRNKIENGEMKQEMLGEQRFRLIHHFFSLSPPVQVLLLPFVS